MLRTPKNGQPTFVQTAPLVSLEQIDVVFGSVVALDDVSLTLAPGSRHAVVGENGAGKSTLMKVLFGLLAPSAGQIRLNDAPRVFSAPSDAIRCGIGMVQQHFELIGSFTAAQNIVLGAEKTCVGGAILLAREAENAVRALGEESGLFVPPNARVDELSVAAQQRVEILKALYRKARVLILDEPTATLAPSEARDLWAATKRLSQSGTTVVFVTHKLSDVMAHADEATVLRKGRRVFSGQTQTTTPAELAANMVGSSSADSAAPMHAEKKVPAVPSSPPPSPAAPEKNSHPILHRAPIREKGVPSLSLQKVSANGRRGQTVLHDINLDIAAGEIVGLAGVDGSGQKELLESIIGLHLISSGQILISGETMTRFPVEIRRQFGMGYVPEDRHHSALILPFSCEENILLGMQRNPAFAYHFPLYGVLNQTKMTGFLEKQTQAFDVRGAQIGLPVKNLSGGNQQKLVLARELARNPALLLVSQPTRGLDFGASAFVHQSLKAARDNGMSILLHSLDLDEILALSDRVAVMLGGQIVGIVSGAQKNEQTIGALMTGAKETASA